MNKKILLIGLIGIVLVSGCLDEVDQFSPSGRIDCDSNISCIEEASKTCTNAFASFDTVESLSLIGGSASQTNQSSQDFEINFAVNRLDGSNCELIIGIAKLDIDKEALANNFKQQNENRFISFKEGAVEFIVNMFDEVIQESLPVELKCTYVYPTDSLKDAECDDIENQFKDFLNSFKEGLERKIAQVDSNNSVLILKLGEIEKLEYEKLIEKKGIFSKGLYSLVAFGPSGTSLDSFDDDLDAIKIDYSVNGLNQGNFVLVNAVSYFESTEKANLFYGSAHSKLNDSSSFITIKDGFFGENSKFIQLSSDQGKEKYRLFYVYKNVFVLFDLVLNDHSLIELTALLTSYANTINSRIDADYSDSFSLDCKTENYTENECVTKYNEEQYEEEECAQREFNYYSTVFEGTEQIGLTLGCYAEVSTTITNNENKNGNWTATINFYDASNNLLKSENVSHGINANSSQTFSAVYDHECGQAEGLKFNGSIAAPSGTFCEMVSKTRQVPFEECEDIEKQKLVCS